MNNNIVKRSIAGSAYVAIVITALVINKISFLFLIASITILAIYEYYNLFSSKKDKPQKITLLFTGIFNIICCFLVAYHIISVKYLSLNIILLIITGIIEIFRPQDKNPINVVAYTLLGVVYIILPLSLTSFFVFTPQSPLAYTPVLLIGIFIIQWGFDTGAYITGITMGKHKLIARISPKKTWEGSFGGLFFSVLAAFLYQLFTDLYSLINWMIIAFLISFFGLFGDLMESMIKRNIGIKDSGNIIPGHGGILDRLDSAFFSIPVIFLYITLFNLK